MIRYIISLVLLFTGIPTSAQTTITGNITHGGLTREYRLYVPGTYSPASPAPLVFNLHGYTSDMLQQEFYGDFRNIADTAGFLLVHPNGTLDGSMNRFWNVGFFPSPVDDVGFLEALIDSLSADYNIDPARIYSTGMSNGGFMSYHLACNSSRFAAIASVTGSMSSYTMATCAPVFPVPVMEIHGTADGVVPYGGTTGIEPVDSALQYWVSFNGCPSPPSMTSVPNTAPLDGATAEYYVYDPGPSGANVEHYKIINGGHTWPGAPITIGVTCMDFSASAEIWRFFSRYSLLTRRPDALPENKMSVFPNPASDILNIEFQGADVFEVECVNLQGKVCVKSNSLHFPTKIDITSLPTGMYLLRIKSVGKISTLTFSKI